MTPASAPPPPSAETTSPTSAGDSDQAIKSRTQSSTTFTLPSETLYWAILPPSAAALPLSGRLFQAEALFPVDGDLLHASDTTLSDGRILLCALPRTRMAQLLKEYPRTISFIPASLPPYLRCSLSDHYPVETANANEHTASIERRLCQQLDFAHGAFEPTALHRWRMATPVLLMLGIAFCATLLVGFLWREGQHYAQAATAYQQAANTLADKALPPAQGAEQRLPPVMRLESAMRAIRAQRGANELLPEDRLPAFAALAQQWRLQPRIQVTALNIDQDGIHLRARLHSLAEAGQAARHLRRLSDPQGTPWLSEDPRTEQSGEHAFLHLIWRNEGSP